MFQVISEVKNDVLELDVLNEYIKYVVKKLELERCEFNIIIIDNEKIREINREYRNIDAETDVISFALEDADNIKIDDYRVLGDIYISIDKCYSQAMEYGHSRERELCFLATHGILHLLGYDHMNVSDEEKMFTLQEELLDGYNIKRQEIINEREIKGIIK